VSANADPFDARRVTEHVKIWSL